MTCPGFLLTKKILEKRGHVLEELLLELPGELDFIQEVIEGCCNTFSRLGILKIKLPSFRNGGYTHLIRSLVSHSPNLQVLDTSGRVNLRGNLLEGSSAVHVSRYPFSPFGNAIPEGVIGRLQLTRMDLNRCDQDLNVNRFNRITFGLLEASRTTLRSMHINALFLAPLTTYGNCLENVRALEIDFEHEKLEIMQPRALRLVKSFDFTRIFPNLKRVGLTCSSPFNYLLWGLHEMLDEGNAAMREPMTDRAANIKNLSVGSFLKIKDSTGRYLAEMFPNVESLSISGTEIPFSRIWEAFHHLKVFDVNQMIDGGVVENLDSVFCGIFPEEVAVLREQDEEYLKAVNIVPVMPSITCLKKLRNLNLSLGKACVSMESLGDPTTYLFSKVAGLIAFQRCPGLGVTIIANETRALSHLRPYATIPPEDDYSFPV